MVNRLLVEWKEEHVEHQERKLQHLHGLLSSFPPHGRSITYLQVLTDRPLGTEDSPPRRSGNTVRILLVPVEL